MDRVKVHTTHTQSAVTRVIVVPGAVVLVTLAIILTLEWGPTIPTQILATIPTRILAIIPAQIMGIIPAQILAITPTRTQDIIPAQIMGIIPTQIMGIIPAQILAITPTRTQDIILKPDAILPTATLVRIKSNPMSMYAYGNTNATRSSKVLAIIAVIVIKTTANGSVPTTAKMATCAVNQIIEM